MGLIRALRSSTRRAVDKRHLRPAALLLIGVVPLALAACGSSSANGASTTTTKPSGTASATAYRTCLSQHGVTLPTGGGFRPPTGGETPPSTTPGSTTPGGFGGGGFGGGGFGGAGGFRNNPKFAKAAAACKSLRPSGGFGGRGGFGGAGGFNSTAFAAYRNCLKLHGLTLPTGGKPTAGAGSTPSTTFNQSSPTVQAALAACAALRPTPSTTTTTAA